MRHCHEIYQINTYEVQYDVNGDPLTRICGRPSFSLSDEGTDALDAVLEPNHDDAFAFFMRLEVSINRGDYPLPWAILVYDKDYPVANHLDQIRSGKQLLGYCSYSVLRVQELPAQISEASIVSIFERHELERLALVSRFLRPAWQDLKNMDSDRSWVCLVTLDDDNWRHDQHGQVRLACTTGDEEEL